jgi:benzoate-CoA ligase family protein
MTTPPAVGLDLSTLVENRRVTPKASDIDGAVKFAGAAGAITALRERANDRPPQAGSEPASFNACHYLLDRRVEAGDGARVALTGRGGELTYAELLDRVQRASRVLCDLGLQPEQRLIMVMADGPEFVTVYLAAMRMGAIPVPVSTMLRPAGLIRLLVDSRARWVAVTPEYGDLVAAAAVAAPELRGILKCGGADVSMGRALQAHDLDTMVSSATPAPDVYPTTTDSPGFWLYTSGTTGNPKAAMHRHGAVAVVSETYAEQVLRLRPDDRCLSSAKGFFAYGLGNSVLFPLATGASAVLEPAPSRPELLVDRVSEYHPTLFFAGPTFFANMLRAELPRNALAGVRLAVSAGEPLPAALYERWTSRFGVDIVDGIGMTETLHIFLSNLPGQVRPGTTGKPVSGYDLKILDELDNETPTGEPGVLHVRAPSAAMGYWSQYDASRRVFRGEWVRTGDTYVRDADGYYTYLGRTGDMLKVSGIWVSPRDIEGQLLKHPAVDQAVVVGAADTDGLERPVAFVVRAESSSVTESELIAFCRNDLAAVHRPRRVIFVDTYPTTATGKVRRVELREQAVILLSEPSEQTQASGLRS